MFFTKCILNHVGIMIFTKRETLTNVEPFWLNRCENVIWDEVFIYIHCVYCTLIKYFIMIIYYN